jgi:hypothetical protein
MRINKVAGVDDNMIHKNFPLIMKYILILKLHASGHRRVSTLDPSLLLNIIIIINFLSIEWLYGSYNFFFFVVY